MARFRDIPRTAAFAWSPDAAQPKIATGTKDGALDIDFSSATALDLWDLTPSSANTSDELRPYATLPVDSR
jgi:protein transport protein SEC31